MKRFTIFALALFSLGVLSTQASAGKELSGMVVVVDAGHGGSDPGAVAFTKDGMKVTESAYCYDVALRLTRILKGKGARVIMTTRNRSWKSPVANAPNKSIGDNKKAVFAFDGSSVRAGSRGLSKRVAVANKALRIRGAKRVVFISIHFDSLGNESLQSARIIAGEGATDFGSLLEEELEDGHRISNSGVPLLKNGDRAHGIRRLYILGRTNHVKQKALIELGNFNNPDDLWRIRNYKIRENYAQIITRALVKLNAQPIRRHH